MRSRNNPPTKRQIATIVIRYDESPILKRLLEEPVKPHSMTLLSEPERKNMMDIYTVEVENLVDLFNLGVDFHRAASTIYPNRLYGHKNALEVPK